MSSLIPQPEEIEEATDGVVTELDLARRVVRLAEVELGRQNGGGAAIRPEVRGARTQHEAPLADAVGGVEAGQVCGEAQPIGLDRLAADLGGGDRLEVHAHRHRVDDGLPVGVRRVVADREHAPVEGKNMVVIVSRRKRRIQGVQAQNSIET